MISSIVTLVIITVLNVFLIRKIKVQSAFRARSTGEHSAPTSSQKQSSLIAMMVSLCVVFRSDLLTLYNNECKLSLQIHHW